MRPIWEVISAIKTRVPHDFEKRADFLNALADISESAAYTAPEAMYIRWNQVADTLGAYLGDPSQAEWKQQVAGIFGATIDYKQFLGANG